MLKITMNHILINFKYFGCHMSTKVHFLHGHSGKFSEKFVSYSEKHQERCRQDLSKVKNRYQGRYDEYMMPDYHWSIAWECPKDLYARKFQKRKKISFLLANKSKKMFQNCYFSIFIVPTISRKLHVALKFYIYS